MQETFYEIDSLKYNYPNPTASVCGLRY